MIYGKPEEEEAESENTTPIRIIPLEEDFRVDLYNLYRVYRPEPGQTDYYFNT